MALPKAVVKSITPSELKSRLDAGEDLHLVDVREAFEKEIADIGGALIPKGEVLSKVDQIPRDKTVVVYCRSGGRSAAVIDALQSVHGFTNLVNLAGGVLRWSDEVDSSVTKY